MATSTDRLIDKYRALTQEAKQSNLTIDEKVELLEQAAYIKGYVAHIRKYSDITVLEDDGVTYREEYFGYVPIMRLVDTEDLPTRRATKLKKEDTKRQLLEYYKYNNAMLAKKLKYYKIMCDLCSTLSEAFGQYGKHCKLKYKNIVEGYDIVRRLKLSIRTFAKEFEYILRARKMRSLYGSYLPENFQGSHRLIRLTEECSDWMYEEENLEEFRDFIAGEEGLFDLTWCSKGIMTPTALETVIRLSLRPNKYLIRSGNPLRTQVRYSYTKDMKDNLPLPLDNTVYIDNLKVRSLIKLLSVPYTDGPLSDANDFLYEMEAIQEYADHAYDSDPISMKNTSRNNIDLDEYNKMIDSILGDRKKLTKVPSSTSSASDSDDLPQSSLQVSQPNLPYSEKEDASNNEDEYSDSSSYDILDNSSDSDYYM